MSEKTKTMIADRKFKSIEDALKISEKASSAYDFKVHEQAMDFIHRELSLIEATNIAVEEAFKAAEGEDWDTYRNCMESVYSLMPVTWVRTFEICSMRQAKFIHDTLNDRHVRNDVDITDEGSAANLLAAKVLDYAYENGSREVRDKIMEVANPQLYELIKYPLGITDDGRKVINLEDCAKALGIPVDEYREMLTDSDFLPEGARVNPIH